MGVFDELKSRGMIAQATNEEKIRDILNNEKISFYIGFDPTADSLHVGHFLQLMVMARMQKAGHRPIAILGGGTAMVGDPSGKTDMRRMMTPETIDYNANCFKSQMSNLVDFSEGKALMLNNADWLLNVKYVDFLREIGVHFSVNKMLTATCFKTRLEKGLSFIEFNYMLMQSYDFYRLYKEYDCRMELGGDDQWSNIIGGVELVRRIEGEEVFGLTFTLLTTSDGKKMGKTEKGAVWLDPNKTTPYEFFQYWRNVEDSDVIKCMKLLTFMALSEIAEYEKLEGSALNTAKEKLAYEVTKIIHGEEEAEKALSTAKSLFGKGAIGEDMPATHLSDEQFTDGGINICDLLTATGLCPSKSEARRLIQQGGISVDEQKITELGRMIVSEFDKGYVVIKKGKKVFHKAIK